MGGNGPFVVEAGSVFLFFPDLPLCVLRSCVYKS
jgi:hypothetical protein